MDGLAIMMASRWNLGGEETEGERKRAERRLRRRGQEGKTGGMESLPPCPPAICHKHDCVRLLVPQHRRRAAEHLPWRERPALRHRQGREGGRQQQLGLLDGGAELNGAREDQALVRAGGGMGEGEKGGRGSEMREEHPPLHGSKTPTQALLRPSAPLSSFCTLSVPPPSLSPPCLREVELDGLHQMLNVDGDVDKHIQAGHRGHVNWHLAEGGETGRVSEGGRGEAGPSNA
jgi:hypothetical protein